MREIRIQPLTNLARNPKPGGIAAWSTTNRGTGGTGTQGYDSATGLWWSEVGVAASNNAYTIRQGGANSSRSPIEEGHSYYMRCEVMSTVLDGRVFGIDWFTSAGGALSSFNSGIRTTLPANQWVTVELLTGPAPATAALADLCIFFAGGTSGQASVIRPVASRLNVRQAMLCDTAHPLVKTGMTYADGSSTGWRWTGTANDSPSVGWPR